MKLLSTLNKTAMIIAGSLLCMQMAQAAVFEIQRVASTDSLNLRAQPGSRNAIVGRVPHNGKWIRTDGRRVAVGRANWIKINWRGNVGWVNEHYVRQMQLNNTPQQPAAAVQPQAAPRPTPQAAPRPVPAPAPRVRPPTITPAALYKKGAWVLECGNRSPFWRVVVHPGKALDVNLRGRNAGILPLTYQKQDKNKWNTAMKTVVKGSNGWFGTDMTVYYTKQCHHTLVNQNTRYRAEALVNGEQMQGCCRAVQIR